MSRYNNERDFDYKLPDILFTEYGYSTIGEYSKELFEFKCRKLLSHDATRGGQVRQNPNRFTGFGRW